MILSDIFSLSDSFFLRHFGVICALYWWSIFKVKWEIWAYFLPLCTVSIPLITNCIFHFAFIVTCCFLNQYFVHNFWSLWNEVFTPHHPFHIRASSISLGVPELIATISNLHKASLSDSFLRILLQNLWAFCHPWNVFSWLTARTSTEN